MFHIVRALSSANYAYSFPLHLLNHLHFLSTTSNYSDASWNFINLFYTFMQFFFSQLLTLIYSMQILPKKPLKSFLHISNLNCIIYQVIQHFPTSASTKKNDPFTNSKRNFVSYQPFDRMFIKFNGATH